jgi:hypothetical protein
MTGDVASETDETAFDTDDLRSKAKRGNIARRGTDMLGVAARGQEAAANNRSVTRARASLLTRRRSQFGGARCSVR